MKYLVVFLVGVFVMGMIGLFVYRLPPAFVEPFSNAWVKTSEEPAPAGVPIVAYWADDVPPQIFCVVKVGQEYYEYTANPSVPGGLLRSYDPAEWISLPGGVR